MEERLKKIERELDEIKVYVNEVISFVSQMRKTQEAMNVFVQSVGTYMTENSKKISEIENNIMEIDKIRHEQIEAVNANVSKLIKISDSTINLINEIKK